MHVPWEGTELWPLKAHESRAYGYFEMGLIFKTRILIPLKLSLLLFLI